MTPTSLVWLWLWLDAGTLPDFRESLSCPNPPELTYTVNACVLQAHSVPALFLVLVTQVHETAGSSTSPHGGTCAEGTVCPRPVSWPFLTQSLPGALEIELT